MWRRRLSSRTHTNADVYDLHLRALWTGCLFFKSLVMFCFFLNLISYLLAFLGILIVCVNFFSYLIFFSSSIFIQMNTKPKPYPQKFLVRSWDRVVNPCVCKSRLYRFYTVYSLIFMPHLFPPHCNPVLKLFHIEVSAFISAHLSMLLYRLCPATVVVLYLNHISRQKDLVLTGTLSSHRQRNSPLGYFFFFLNLIFTQRICTVC